MSLKEKLLIGLLISLLVLGLAACATQTAVPAQVAAPISDVPPTATVAEGIMIPVEAPMAELETVNQCLVCHTDKDMLIETAAPKVEVIKESEGVG